jgi:hypothetical protein
MSATLYHGTRRPFAKGGLLLPQSKHGGAGTHAPLMAGATSPADASGYVYVTTSETLAWVYAWCAPGRGKPRVLIVGPCGEVERDPEHSLAMEAFRCEAAAVLAVDLVPKVDEADAREGWIVD